MTDTCAWCDAPKTFDAVCRQCGANYAKAEAIKKHGSAKSVLDAEEAQLLATPYVASATTAEFDDAVPDYQSLVKDPDSEWLNCLYAVPAMLMGAWACQYWNVFDNFQRIVFGMPLHELGHALTAWLSGYNAIPTFWVTHTASEQGYTCMLLLFALYAFLLRYAKRTQQRYWYAVVATLLVVQLYCTFVLGRATADMLFIPDFPLELLKSN
jgi:hypothetical protein